MYTTPFFFFHKLVHSSRIMTDRNLTTGNASTTYIYRALLLLQRLESISALKDYAKCQFLNATTSYWRLLQHCLMLAGYQSQQASWYRFQQSCCRCAGVRRPSVSRLIISGFFLRNRYMDPGQILWKNTYSPYLRTGAFFFFSKILITFFFFFFGFVNMGPYGIQHLKKRYFSHSFKPISTKLYDKCDSHGGIQAVSFLSICQKLKISWHFEIFVQDYMGLEISKRYSSHSFHPIQAKLYEDIGYHGGIQAITFLGNRPS